MVPTRSLLRGYAGLYFVPMIVVTAAATGLRARLTSRWIGSVVLALVFVAVILALGYSSSTFDMVNASG